MYDICCIGHITLDKIVTPKSEVYMSGGTSFYFSNAIHKMSLDYMLVTALAESEMAAVSKLRADGIEVKVLPSSYTVYFENRYSDNHDYRTQRVFQKADAFTAEQLDSVEAKLFHLGPLLADDMGVEMIRALSQKGKVSLDVQGFLREVNNQAVVAIDWANKKEGLQYIDILKANEYEMKVLTGVTDIRAGARLLFDWGVKEVIITLGSKGSVIYSEGKYFDIPAYVPVAVVDGTGCGDTYMAGYLFKRLKGAGLQEAGEFAAAMATKNIESSGPFTGTEEDVLALLSEGRSKVFVVE
jgi:sugar/nucleoside kinase (ribokinase family)